MQPDCFLFRYMKRFAKTVVKVLTAYTDLLKSDFHNHVRDETTVRWILGLEVWALHQA